VNPERSRHCDPEEFGKSGRLPHPAGVAGGGRRPHPSKAAGVDTRGKGAHDARGRVTSNNAATYPFSAVVGSEDMALALILTTVAPEIGGVLVRGHKGTAKTTMVRALAGVLPPLRVVVGCRFSCDPLDPDPTCPDGPHPEQFSSRGLPTGTGDVARPARLVELPVGASEDRVIGSLDLKQALGSGEVNFQPGLLAAAHRGILYVDEVNLLHDHLVDLLLDAAATGRSTVEREGVSVAHASRIVLVGTMNPEEGELRPQLLDRFGLTVEIEAPSDPELRAEVIRRRMAYDRNPAAFARTYALQEEELRDRIVGARSLVSSVKITDRQLILIATVCAGFEVDGLRADIVTARAATAHAAWHGRQAVQRDDIRAAARLALPHRRRRKPFDAPGLDEALLDRLLGEDDPGPDGGPPPPEDPSDGPPGDPARDADAAGVDAVDTPPSQEREAPPDPDGQAHTEPAPTETSAASSPGSRLDSLPGRIAAAGQIYRTRLFTAAGVGRGEAGRRSRALTTTGRAVGATAAIHDHGQLHFPATLRAAAPHQGARGRQPAQRVRFAGNDLRLAVTEGRESNLVLLVVDASGSMAARRRMEAVKAAALSLLVDAYQRRDKVGLITFRGSTATLALPPTSSIEVAARRLAELPSGGRTPLAEGLLCAAETLRVERIRDPRRRPLLVLVTDGRATHGRDAVIKSRLAADQLRRSSVPTLVVDCETGRLALGLAARLCQDLGGEYVRIGDLAADQLVRTINLQRSVSGGRGGVVTPGASTVQRGVGPPGRHRAA
jgi:magnesium chelatase subunit D